MAVNYYIISLTDGLALVPSTWLTADQKQCYWPNKYTKARTDVAIRRREIPQVSEDWSLLTISKVYGSSDTFERGFAKLKKSEWVSDLESGNTSTDDCDGKLQKTTRHSRAIRKESSESDGLDEPSHTPQRSMKSSKLSQTKNTTLSSFPEPPPSLTVVDTLNDNMSSIIHQTRKQKPVVVATFDSPIINEERFEKNSHIFHTPLVDTLDYSTDHNDNILQTESADKRKVQLCKQSTRTPTMGIEAELIEEVLHKLNKLMFDVKSIKDSIRQMNSDKNVNQTDVDLDVIKVLPLTTFHELEHIEVKLEDETFFQQLVKILSGVGGYDDNNITTNILKRLLSNVLAVEYSLLGKKNKKSFSNLRLMKVVIGAVRLHNKAATETSIAQYIGRWLVQARQRHERELEKLQKKNDAVDE